MSHSNTHSDTKHCARTILFIIIVLLFTKNKNCDLEMKKRFTPERVKPVEAELI